MNRSHDHDMAVSLTQHDRSRRAFVATLRSHVLQRMAGDLRQHFEGTVRPEHEKSGAPLESPEAIHEALKPELPFKAYSSVRTAAQEMVFDVVSDAVDRELETLNERAAQPAKKESDAQFGLALAEKCDRNRRAFVARRLPRGTC